MATAKVGQNKEKDFDSIVPRYGYCDMNDETKREVIEVCREACKMQHDNELKYYKDMAIHIKGVLDKNLGGSFHIIVGKHSPPPPPLLLKTIVNPIELQARTSAHL